MDTNEIVVLSAVRTPIGKFMGSFVDLSAAHLGAAVIREAIAQARIAAEQVDEVILGSVLTAGAGQNVARQAAIFAGIPQDVPAYTINMVCGSGMQSIILAARMILTGEANFVIAGGTENMSLSPYLLPRVRTGLKMGHSQLIDSMITDGLTDTFNDIHMGIIAENISEKYGISREEQDVFAQRSQTKARIAVENGRFNNEIVPVTVHKNHRIHLVEQDEYPRFDSSLEGLNQLKPAFKPNGTVTAGNSSGINDGAAVLVIANRSRAKALGLSPIASIRTWGTAGVDPALMGMGPIPATKIALNRAKLSLKDIDLVESNEAFAAQCLAVTRDLNIPDEILNVNGGAIALGHPIGASGTRITVTLIHEMLKRQSELGLAMLCIGGGMGAALIISHPDL
jgi:acetyl-CoA C-acetyltransferase